MESKGKQQTEITINNPLIDIWKHPRETFKVIIYYDRFDKYFGLLISSYGLVLILNLIYKYGFNSSFIFPILISPIYGYFYSLLSALFIYWVGKIFGGKASLPQIHKIVVWSILPYVISISIIIIIGLLLYGSSFLSQQILFILNILNPLRLFQEIIVSSFYIMFASTVTVLSQIYRFVLLVIGISEIQGIKKSHTVLSLLIGGFFQIVFGLIFIGICLTTNF